jgi:hypothetical protein
MSEGDLALPGHFLRRFGICKKTIGSVDNIGADERGRKTRMKRRQIGMRRGL